MRRPERDARLAGAAGSSQRDEPRLAAEQGRDRIDLRSAADERRRRSGQVPTVPHRLRLDVERCVLTKDRALERAQLRGRLEPELVERVPDLGVGVERLGLPAGAVEPEHQQAEQPLPQGMLGRQPPELRDVQRVTERQHRLGAILDRRHAQVVEPVALASRRGVLDTGERGAAPEGESVVERRERLLVAPRPTVRLRSVEQPLELGRVQPPEPKQVPVACPVDLEPRLPELGDVHLERMGRAGGRAVAPDRVQQALVRDRRAARGQQRDEERLRLRAARERHAVDLQRSEHPVLHDPSS